MWRGAVANPAVLNEVFRITGVKVAHDPVKILRGNPPNVSQLSLSHDLSHGERFTEAG